MRLDGNSTGVTERSQLTAVQDVLQYAGRHKIRFPGAVELMQSNEKKGANSFRRLKSRLERWYCLSGGFSECTCDYSFSRLSSSRWPPSLKKLLVRPM